MNVKKSNSNTYIYTLILDNFCVFIVTVQCKLRKIRSIRTLLTNLVGHNVTQLVVDSLFICDVTQGQRHMINCRSSVYEASWSKIVCLKGKSVASINICL